MSESAQLEPFTRQLAGSRCDCQKPRSFYQPMLKRKPVRISPRAVAMPLRRIKSMDGQPIWRWAAHKATRKRFLLGESGGFFLFHRVRSANDRALDGLGILQQVV